MSANTCQGWSNRNTWRVAVRIGNYKPLYDAVASLKKAKPKFSEKDILKVLKPFYKYSDLEFGDGEIDLAEIAELVKNI
jgi:hypothetical protein